MYATTDTGVALNCNGSRDYFISLVLRGPDLVHEHGQLVLVLLPHGLESSLAQLEALDELLLQGDLTRQVGQLLVVVLCNSQNKAN